MSTETPKNESKITLYQTRDMLMETTIGNIEKLRLAMGWTQAKMAEVMDSTEPTVSNYLKKKRLPPFEFIVHLCRLPEIRERGLNLTLEMLIDKNFDPQSVLKRRKTAAPEIRQASQQSVRFPELEGVYLCYLFDSADTAYQQDYKSIRAQRYGVLAVYNAYDDLTGGGYQKGKMVFFRSDEQEQAMELVKQLRSYYKASYSPQDRSTAIDSAMRLKKDGIILEGTVVFNERHGFLNLCDPVTHDQATVVFHNPRRDTAKYYGGLATFSSAMRGYSFEPTVQKMLFSKSELRCSEDLIAARLKMVRKKGVRSSGAEAIAALCHQLYCNEEMRNLIEEPDKVAMIDRRLDQLVENFCSANDCVGIVTEDDDRETARFLEIHGDHMWESGEAK